MNILKSILCESNGIMIFCYVLDVVLLVAALTLFIVYNVKSSKSRQKKSNYHPSQESIEKINDDTYVIEADSEEEQLEPVQRDNAVEHFVNQISDINEPTTNELKSNAVIVNHQVEAPVKKLVKKEEIENFVMIDGVKKVKTEPERIKAVNRGTNAFHNSTNFLNTIKNENASAVAVKEPVKEEKTVQPAVKKTTTKKAPAKTTASKTSTAKKTATKKTTTKK